MMKNCIFTFFVVTLIASLNAQTLDSFALLQVDSLIQVSRHHTANNDYEQALLVNSNAENIALLNFGKESTAYGKSIFNRGRVNHFRRDFNEAEKWYLESKTILEKVLGSENELYGQNLYNLGVVYFESRQYAIAEPLLLESLTIRKKILPEDHPNYDASLSLLGNLYFMLEQYKKVEPLFLTIKNIRDIKYGKHHENYAGVLYNLAMVYRKMGNYQKAEPLYLESLAIFKELVGENHPSYDNNLNDLALLHIEINQYEEAEKLLLLSKAIREKIYGKDHYRYADCIHSLACLYEEKGQYETAEAYFLTSIRIKELQLGKNHPEYAISNSSLASFYRKTGQYDKSERLELETLSIREKVLGKEHPRYAESLNNLAILYSEMGNFAQAESLYLQSLNIEENAIGKEDPEYASGLNNLAILYWRMHQYDKAEQRYLESIALKEKIVGKEHLDYAVSLNNLAILYKETGKKEDAESLFLESKKTIEKTYGKEHPDFASVLHNLATLYTDMGKYEQAEQFFLDSKAIREMILGKEHPDFSLSLNNLARLFELQSRYNASTPLLAEAQAYTLDRIIRGVSFLSENELSNYLNVQFSNAQVNTYLLNRPKDKVISLPDISYDQTLFHKGFLMQAAIKIQSLTGTSQESIEINDELKSVRRRIAQECSKPITARQQIEQLESRANALEKELARTVAGYATALRQVKWQEVQAALTSDAIALEFVHFNVTFPNKTDSIMYAVVLLRPGAAQPEFIPLFEQRELDHLLDGDRDRKADYVNELYVWSERGMVKLGNAKKSLYELIWSKIETTGLEGIKTIYYAPSGVLHRLNLGAIAVDEETILSDRYNLVALSSTRQLVTPSTIHEAAKDAILVGGVNFEVDTTHISNEEEYITSRSLAGTWIEAGTRGGTWSYLKWTEREVERIATSLTTGGFDANQMTGSEATEEAIKTISSQGASPRILHLATHGFFFSDSEQNMTSNMNVEPVFKSSDNPMIRSGLILAGGNYAWQHGHAPRPDMEDGILTAYEISQMNLSNTELVVLSACETGLGDIQGNEGVYGLQRAFKIAGAKYLIMSLWQVPDRETMEFMTTFYKNWLEGKMTIPDAFRKTQREMRDRFYNPYSWAGFVLVE